MSPEAAEDIARDALIWLAGKPEELGQFLAETGASPVDLRAGSRDPAFLGAVLDFILGGEPRLLAFAGEFGLDPALPARARFALPGGGLPHWT